MSELVYQYIIGVGGKVNCSYSNNVTYVVQKKYTLQRSRDVFTFILLSDVLIGLHIILLL